jgi:hypothetical protein
VKSITPRCDLRHTSPHLPPVGARYIVPQSDLVAAAFRGGRCLLCRNCALPLIPFSCKPRHTQQDRSKHYANKRGGNH